MPVGGEGLGKVRPEPRSEGVDNCGGVIAKNLLKVGSLCRHGHEASEQKTQKGNKA
jgi:hypothetical protein